MSVSDVHAAGVASRERAVAVRTDETLDASVNREMARQGRPGREVEMAHRAAELLLPVDEFRYDGVPQGAPPADETVTRLTDDPESTRLSFIVVVLVDGDGYGRPGRRWRYRVADRRR